jgi:rubrerythrin
MQEGHTDYYETQEGCCLICSDAHPGCLCYDCNCTKCFWYSYEGGGKGSCDKKYELINIRKKELKKYYEDKDKKEHEKTKLLNSQNEDKYKEIKDKGEIPNTYTCQQCGRDFVTEKSFVIKIKEQPLCPICLEEK